MKKNLYDGYLCLKCGGSHLASKRLDGCPHCDSDAFIESGGPFNLSKTSIKKGWGSVGKFLRYAQDRGVWVPPEVSR